jgi:hypothetical protein
MRLIQISYLTRRFTAFAIPEDPSIGRGKIVCARRLKGGRGYEGRESQKRYRSALMVMSVAIADAPPIASRASKTDEAGRDRAELPPQTRSGTRRDPDDR